MKQQSSILFWKRMTSRKFDESDLLHYSLADLKHQEKHLNQFIETFCREGIFNDKNLVKVSTDLIAWSVFAIGISIASTLDVLRIHEQGIQIYHLFYLIFLIFAYCKLINRIVKYPEHKAIYRFLKSEFYRENHRQLSKTILFLEGK